MDSVVQSLYSTYDSMDDKEKKKFLDYVKDNQSKDVYELLLHTIEVYEYVK